MIPVNAESAHTGELLKWTEKDVRRLLRLLKRPHRLVQSPLARALCQIRGATDHYAAVLTTIDQAFALKGAGARQLRDLIWHCDVESSVTHVGAASAMHLSTRQFFRYRSEAVAALLSHINRLFEQSAETVSPIAALARLLEDIDPNATVKLNAICGGERSKRSASISAQLNAGDTLNDFLPTIDGTAASLLDAVKIATAREIHGDRLGSRSIIDAVRAELFHHPNEWRILISSRIAAVECVAARHSGRCDDMQSAVRRLADAARGPEEMLQAKLLEVESAIVCGDLEVAEARLNGIEQLAWERRSIRDLGTATLRRAQLLFNRGFTAASLEVATAARLALHQLPYPRFECDLLLARLRLLLALPFDVQASPFGMPSWSFAYECAVRARGDLHAGNVKAARARAHKAGAISEAQGYASVQTFNEVTLAALEVQQGNVALSQRRLVDAWVNLAITQNHLLARDAFECPGLLGRDVGPVALNDVFKAGLSTVLQTAFSDLPLVSDASARSTFCEVLTHIVLSSAAPQAKLRITHFSDKCAQELRKSGHGYQAIHGRKNDLIRFLEFAFSAPLKFEARDRFRQSFSSLISAFFLSVEQSMASPN